MLLHRHFEEDGKKANKNMTTSVDVSPFTKNIEEGVDETLLVTPSSSELQDSSVDESVAIASQRRGRPRRG